MKDAYDHAQAGAGGPIHPAALLVVKRVIAVAIMLCVSERAIRHLLDGQPFLEI
jgi:hypothetical protein